MRGGPSWPRRRTLWKQDFGNAKASGGGEIVPDAAAPGGKALRPGVRKGGAACPTSSACRGLTLAGRGTLRLLVRGEGLNDIANGLRLTVNFRPEIPGGGCHTADGVVYGVRAAGGAYSVLPITFDVGDKPAKYTMVINPEWQRQSPGRAPTVWLGSMELVAQRG